MIIKFKPRMFGRSSKSGKSSSKRSDKVAPSTAEKPLSSGGEDLLGEIKWELRPGGMLVQKRDSIGAAAFQKKKGGGGGGGGEGPITIRLSSTTLSHLHDYVSVESTSTFGELKSILSLITGLEPREQRLLYRGKERGDDEHLHMVGVRDKDKILLLEDPAIKEMKLRSSRSLSMNGAIEAVTTAHYHHLLNHQHPYRTISV